MSENYVAFGHIVPKHAIPSLNQEIVEQCVEKKLEEVELAVLDRKGIKGKDKTTLIEMLRDIDLPFKKAKDLRYLPPLLKGKVNRNVEFQLSKPIT